MSSPVPSGAASFAEYLDMLAWLLSTDSRTSRITWILGDVGMGAPQHTPFAYISPFGESVRWYTTGGLPGGVTGVDDWDETVVMTVAFEPHRYVPPVHAVPPVSSPVSQQTLGVAPAYWEQPGFRKAMETSAAVKAVLRANITVLGEIATSRVTEARYVLQVVQGKLYRAARITVAAQQRRRRGT